VARTVRDAKLETRAARDRLTPGATPHWKTLVPGKLHLGYRRKRKDEPGQWLVRHYVGGERYQKVPIGLADDFQDAADTGDVMSFADAQRAALAHRMERRRPGKGASVADALSDYVAAVGAERRGTAEHAARTAEKLIVPRLGRIKLADLTTDDIIAWRDALAREGARLRTKPGEQQRFKEAPLTEEERRARRATVNRVLAVLKAALNHAFKNKRVADDHAWRHAEAFKKVDAARPGFLTVEECQRLVNAADADSGFRDMVRAALLTGCRYGELCALTVRDFYRGKIHVSRSKSGKARDVALTPEGSAFFEQTAAGRAGDEPLLRNASGHAWTTAMQARPMQRACAAARIVPPVGFHQLRHTYASLSVMADMPLLVLARNLGHADTRMVEKNYAHLTEDYVDAAVRAHAPKFGFAKDKKLASLPR